MNYRVFVVEDQIEATAVETAFDADALSRPGGEPRLELVGLAQNHSDAIEQLQALEASPDDGLPDAIVLDDYLPDGDSASSRSLQIMTWLHEAAVGRNPPLTWAERPRTVLWSSCEPNFVYAFCALGGLWYQLKKDPGGQDVPVPAIWWALAGFRWRPEPYPVDTQLSQKMRDALPFLEHGWTQKKTALHLGLGEKGLQGFTATVKKMPRAPGPMSSDYPANDAGAIRVLKQSGWVWVPYRLQDQMPNRPPLPLVIDPMLHWEDLPPREGVPDEYGKRPDA